MTVQTSMERPAVRRRSQGPADLTLSQATQRHFLRAYATTDPIVKASILDDVVLVNLPVADRLAIRYAGRGIASDDLVQIARLGLVQAVHRFDPGAGFDFLSFAVPTMLGELKRYFRDRGWAVRPPRRIQELRPRVMAATAELTQTLVRTPTRAEVADHLGVNESAIGEALVADGGFTAISLDRPVLQDSRTSAAMVDAMGDDDPSLEWVEAKLMLAPIIRKLSDRDRLILRLRFVDDMTQREIGGLVGVTQMQVSRILARIMRLAKVELAG